MTDRENFLERWSRRKVKAQRDAVERPDAAEPAQTSTDAAVSAPVASVAGQKLPAAAPETPSFDIASLPSIESITAATDIRAFLKPGVPAELTRAALRRVWAADPTIRDFKGLQESDWNFNDPDGVPGFGRFAPGEDIKKLIAQVFGEVEAEADKPKPVDQAKPEAQPDAVAQPIEEAKSGNGLVHESPVVDRSAAPSEARVVQRDSIAALQDKDSRVEPQQPPSPRKHGRALPE